MVVAGRPEAAVLQLAAGDLEALETHAVPIPAPRSEHFLSRRGPIFSPSAPGSAGCCVVCWAIAYPHFKSRARLRVALTPLAAFLLYVWLGVSVIEVLLLAAVIGALLPPAPPNRPPIVRCDRGGRQAGKGNAPPAMAFMVISARPPATTCVQFGATPRMQGDLHFRPIMRSRQNE